MIRTALPGWRETETGLPVLRRQLRRLNPGPHAQQSRHIDTVLAWLRHLPWGIEGNYRLWQGLTEGVEGMRLIDWDTPSRNHFAVTRRGRMPLDAVRPNGASHVWLYPDTVGWINGLPLVLMLSRPGPRGLWRLWTLTKRYQLIAQRWMTMIQIVVMMQRPYVWAAPSWNLPTRSPARSALRVSDVAAWLKKVFAPDQFLAWLRRGLKFQRDAAAVPLTKTLVFPDTEGDLPGWVTGTPTTKSLKPNTKWSPEEKRQRERQVGDWMEKCYHQDYAISPSQMAYRAGYYFFDTEPRLTPWLIAVAQRVKSRVAMQRLRAEQKAWRESEASDVELTRNGDE